MSTDLAERVAVVETKLENFEQSWGTVSSKLESACDYILAEKARKSFVNKSLTYVGAFIAAGGTLFEVFWRK